MLRLDDRNSILCSATVLVVVLGSVHALFTAPTIPLNKEAAE